MLHLDTGNTGFMLLCSSLVMLMTPGLAFFYGGLVGRKNVLAIMIQSFVSMGWTTVIWYLYGYSLCFSGDWHGIIGNLNNFCLRGITLTTPSPNDTIPAIVFIAYQMMFAIITPALISGAFTNRVTFKAYMSVPDGVAHLRVLPLRAHGVGRRHPAALGRGRLRRRHRGPQHRRTGGAGFRALRGQAPRCWIAARTAFRWWLWAPGCCGSAGMASTRAARFRVDSVTATAFLNTDIAASFAAVAWLLVAWIRERKPKFLGLLTGAVAGLATITPAAGYVSPTTAVIIGIVSGVVCYFAVETEEQTALGRRAGCLGRSRSRRLPRHRDAGTVRQQALSIPPAATDCCTAIPSFFVKQLVAVLFSSVWAFGFTYAMLHIINLFTPVKVDEMSEEIGLDESLHGEHAYETLEVEELFNGDHQPVTIEHIEEEHELVGSRK